VPSYSTPKDQKDGRAPWRWTADTVIASIWIAVCAATPEFIWRGGRVVARHFSWSDLASALFIGLILAFCIEPAMERARDFFSRKSQTHSDHLPASRPLFAAAMGLAFAVSSVCLHDAITAFLSANSEDHVVRSSGLVTGIRLASAWAMVPFFISLAWLSAGRHLLRIPLGLLAAVSPLIAAQLFSWSVQDTITTELPCVVILMLGYREIAIGRGAQVFLRCSGTIAWLAPAWLASALLFDYCFDLLRLSRFELYNIQEFWVDARFYFGWMIGLRLAPLPRHHFGVPTVATTRAESSDLAGP
jgi:hypothetical protein